MKSVCLICYILSLLHLMLGLLQSSRPIRSAVGVGLAVSLAAGCSSASESTPEKLTPAPTTSTVSPEADGESQAFFPTDKVVLHIDKTEERRHHLIGLLAGVFGCNDLVLEYELVSDDLTVYNPLTEDGKKISDYQYGPVAIMLQEALADYEATVKQDDPNAPADNPDEWFPAFERVREYVSKDKQANCYEVATIAPPSQLDLT